MIELHFFISVVRNKLHRHIPFYKIPPNTCLVAQFLHGVWSSKRFVVQVPLLNQHILYRQDHVFLHPMRASRLLNILLDMNEGEETIVRKDVRHRNLKPHQVALLYHKGQPLFNLSVNCFQCDLEKREIKIVRHDNYDFKITFPLVFSSMYVMSDVAEYPRGLNVQKDLFPSFDFNPDNVAGTEYIKFFEQDFGYKYDKVECNPMWERSESWISSKIYHIDCSQPIEEISEWSELNHWVIEEICRFEDSRVISLKEGLSKYILWSRTTDPSDLSYLWTLKLSIRSHQEFNRSTFGVLMLTTEGKPGMCDSKFQTGMSIAVPEFVGFGVQTGKRLRFHTCAYLYTLARIDSKFINKGDAFEIGFQLFYDNEISFHLLNPLLNSTNITYHWKLIKYTNTSQSIRLLNFTSQRYSWLMALAECKRHGMTLPHLMDRKSTMEFVAKILHTSMSPPFAFFVGLIRKVTYFVLISCDNIPFEWNDSS